MITNNELERKVPNLEATIEVTPAMAKAGARLLAEKYDSLGDRVDELIATELFRSMASHAPSVHT